jgi:hypothetical protein
MKTATQSMALVRLQEVYKNSTKEQKKLFDMRIPDFPFGNRQTKNYFLSLDPKFDPSDALTFYEFACMNCEDISSNQKLVCFKQGGLLSIAYTSLSQRSPFLKRADEHFKEISRCYYQVGLYKDDWPLLKKAPLRIEKKEQKSKKAKKQEKPLKEKIVPIAQITVDPKNIIHKDLGELVGIDSSSRIFLENFLIRKNGSILNGVITKDDFLALSKDSVVILTKECGKVTLKVLVEIQNYLTKLGIEEEKNPFLKWKF